MRSWDFFERHPSPQIEFRNLDTLFGHVVTTGDMVIGNSPADDPRAAGTPADHPR